MAKRSIMNKQGIDRRVGVITRGVDTKVQRQLSSILRAEGIVTEELWETLSRDTQSLLVARALNLVAQTYLDTIERKDWK